MRLPFPPFLILWFASGSAQLCGSSREYAVDNCTACPTLDHSHGDIGMAICEERAANTSSTSGSTCACHGPHSIGMALVVYFPHVDGSGTRCANSWETAPHAYAALTVVSGSALLYATAHLFYIAMFSGICSCRRHKCTKTNIAALFIGMHELLMFIALVAIRVASQGKNAGARGAVYYIWVRSAMRILNWCACSFLETGFALYFTSICDMLYPGEEMNRRRRSINLSLWLPASLATMCTIFMVVVFCVSEDLSEIINVYVAPLVLCVRYLAMLYGNIFMIIAHRAMHQVSLHPTSLA